MKWYAYVIIALAWVACADKKDDKLYLGDLVALGGIDTQLIREQARDKILMELAQYHNTKSFELLDEVNKMTSNMGTMQRKLDLSRWHHNEAVRIAKLYGL